VIAAAFVSHGLPPWLPTLPPPAAVFYDVGHRQ
jgi:hypothetical protein